ncbi:coiled-coil domain-containing protein 80 [Ambystoma mexicanum]|uniref:coiled-coil domain-containing protein 80 n=1 Tax=Ambystoma mexicanum TaxID=8296 RepID=UPI0037E7203A
MNWVTLLNLTMLLAAWVVCGSERPNGQADRGSHGARKPPSAPAQRDRRTRPALRRLRSPQGERSFAPNPEHSSSPRRKVVQRRRSPQPTLLPPKHKLQVSNIRTQNSQVENPAVQTSQLVKDDSTTTRSRMVRFPSASSSPNILASFAGKNRVWIISAPHASDGYYRLMMTLLKDDVYCELAERHIQQIVLFHQEGEEAGKVRRITNEGRIMEQPLDPSLIPKLMSSFKLEKGKFGMVLLKKTLQVEEKYPYPVRMEALYEVVDQSPIRRIEKIRQKGFVQKCKAAGVEGQITEGEGQDVKPTQSSDRGKGPTRKEEPKKSHNVQPTREVQIKTTRKLVTTAPPTPPPTTRATTIATTPAPVTTTTTRATTRIVTVATRAPATTTTTVLPTTQRAWTTRVHSTIDMQKLTTTAEVSTRGITTEDTYAPVRTNKRKERQHVPVPSKPKKESGFDIYAHAPTALTTTSYPYMKPSSTRFVDNQTDKKDGSLRDPHPVPSQPKLPKAKPPKKKTAEKILNNEYEDKYNTGRPTLHPEEEVDVPNVPPKKVKEQKKLEKPDKAEKKKKKLEKQEKLPRSEKVVKKEKPEKKAKPDKDRGRKSKKPSKSENEEFIKPATKPFVQSTKRSLTTFLDYFEGKRRLLLITSPKEENNMYVQQRDEYLETICEMAVRKISIITIFGTMTNSTMKIDHFQLDNEKPMKVIGNDDLLDQDLINEFRKEYGATYNDFFMVLTDTDMKVKQYYEVPIAMKSVFDLVDTFQARIKEMEKQKKDGISCKKEDKTRSLENFLSRFRWRRRLFVISAPNDEEWAYQQQLYSLSGQACHLGLRHLAVLKLVGVGIEGGGVLELYPINGSSSVDREDVPLHLVKDIRNYFQVSPEYFSMLLVGKDGNVKSWYPSPMWSMSIVYDLIDSMQLRRQEMAIQQSLGMRCPEDEYAGYGYHGYHNQGYQEGYQDDYRHHEGYYHGYHD